MWFAGNRILPYISVAAVFAGVPIICKNNCK